MSLWGTPPKKSQILEHVLLGRMKLMTHSQILKNVGEFMGAPPKKHKSLSISFGEKAYGAFTNTENVGGRLNNL